MILQWYVGFHRPSLRNATGKIDPRTWFGHCEVWGFTKDQTWLFLDPQGAGTLILVTHHHDDVSDQLEARYSLCSSILVVESAPTRFRIPIHGMTTCASIIGHLLGTRALFPSTLRWKLLAKGARVIHETERRSGRQSRKDA